MKRVLLILLAFICAPVIAGSEHDALVDTYIEVSGTKAIFEQTASIGEEGECTEEKPPCEGMLLNMFDSFIGWEALRDDVRKEVKRHFTENELKQLIEFYRTDLGKKYAEKSVQISDNLNKIIERRMIYAFEAMETLEEELNDEQPQAKELLQYENEPNKAN